MSNSWIAGVKNILDMCGFSNIWSEQNIVNFKWISTIVKPRLQDQYIQKWSSEIHDSSKGQILVMKITLIYCHISLERFLSNLETQINTILL